MCACTRVHDDRRVNVCKIRQKLYDIVTEYSGNDKFDVKIS